MTFNDGRLDQSEAWDFLNYFYRDTEPVTIHNKSQFANQLLSFSWEGGGGGQM